MHPPGGARAPRSERCAELSRTAARPPAETLSSDESPRADAEEREAASEEAEERQEQQQERPQQQRPSPGKAAPRPRGVTFAFDRPQQQRRQEGEGQQEQAGGEGEDAAEPMEESGGEGTPAPPGGEAEGPLDVAGTPYDNVLAMLRQGPLSMNSPRFTFRPRSASQPALGSALRSAGAGGAAASSPAPSSQFAPSPSPPLFSAGRTPGPPGRTPGVDLQQRRLGTSRFAPGGGGPAAAGAAGAAATPGGLRPGGGFGGRTGSRVQFARTPLAAGAAKAGAAGPSAAAAAPASAPRFSALPPAQDGAGAAGLSPAPLAWTPMRSNAVALKAGGKRKADSESPGEEGGWQGGFQWPEVLAGLSAGFSA